MIEAVAYARVSTDSEDQLNSLENQMSFFGEYFIENGYKAADCGVLCRKNGENEVLQGTYADEGISGKNLSKREAFKQMLREAKLGKFKLIVTKSVARFGRNVEDTAKAVKDLKELGVGVYFLDLKVNSLDSSKEFMINLFAALAQEENNNRSYITQFGIRKAQKEGKWTTGNPPFGYNIVDGFLQVDPTESEIVKRIYDLYYYSGYGTGRLARLLNEERIPTKKNKQWSQKQLMTILENPIYTGVQTTHTKQTIDINRGLQKRIPREAQIVHHFEHLKIIEPDFFKLVQIEKKKRKELFGYVEVINEKVVNDEGEIETKKKRKLHRSNRRYSSEHLLSNLLVCSHCGVGLKRKKRHAHRRKDGTSKNLGYEWCCAINDMYGRARCAYRSSMPEDKIIEFLINELKRIKDDDEYFDSALRGHISLYYEEENVPQRLILLGEQIQEINEEIKTNLRLVSKNILTDEQFDEFNGDAQARLNSLQREHNRLMYLDVEIEEVKLKHQAFLKMLETIDVDQLTNSSLRKLIRKVDFVTMEANEIRLRLEWNYMDISYSQRLRDRFLKEYGTDKVSLDINIEDMDNRTREEFEEATEKLINWTT
ncbi:recombinase family protein [Paenibacillus filicis]|uniref:Recombinase family protein n=1 Tax=Paenibacillus filicis TaxID=669464 RepID=A0ABU9DPU6_9BACL